MRRVTCTACGVKNEKLAFLSDNTKYTLRFAMQIGGLCRAMTITDVARRMHLDWHTVKELDMVGDIFCGLGSQRIQPQNGSQIRSRKHAVGNRLPAI